MSGRPHRIEIWFFLRDRTLYLLSGGRESSDWVRNLETTPEVTIEVGDRMWSGTARLVEPGTDEDALARRLVLEKYTPRDSSDLTGWGKTSLPIAIDLAAEG